MYVLTTRSLSLANFWGYFDGYKDIRICSSYREAGSKIGSCYRTQIIVIFIAK